MRVLVCGLFALLGCAGTFDDSGTIRVVDGERVLGRYVSPAAYQHYLQARLFALEGAHAEAARELRQALGADPDSPELHTLLARSYLELGQLDAAAGAVREALRCDHDAADALVVRAELEERRGELDAARASLEHAIRAEPAHEEAGLRMAELSVRRGDRAEALRWLVRTAAERPNDRALRYEIVGLYEELGRTADAEAALRRLCAEDPGDVDARLRLGRLFERTGRVELAVTTLRGAFDMADDVVDTGEALVEALVDAGQLPAARDVVDVVEDRASRSDVEQRLRVSALLRRVGRPERARAVLLEVLERKPAQASARVRLAELLAEAGELAPALAELDRVPLDAPEGPGAVRQAALLLVRRGRGEEAGARVERALAEARRRKLVTVERLVLVVGEVYERRGDVGRALTHLRSAATQAPASEPLQLALASLLERHGDAAAASELVQRALARRPASVSLVNFHAYSLVQRGQRLDEAERLLRQALAREPRNGAVTDSLGWCLFKRGLIDEAQRMLELADRLAPGEPEILRHLGDLRAFQRDRKRALELYRRALASGAEEPLRAELEALVRDLEANRKASK